MRKYIQRDISYIGDNRNVLYSENQEKLRRVLRWKSIEVFNEHYYPGGKFRGMQIVFSSGQYNRIADVFGLPKKKKSQGRVDHGKKMNRNNKKGRK